MKKFQFLLLDAGPIIKLFELEIWQEFISRCDVTIAQQVAEESKWARGETEDCLMDLAQYSEDGGISIIDIDASKVAAFTNKFSAQLSRVKIDPGELEILSFLTSSEKSWFVCSADGAVFRFLGMIGKGQDGISLEEVLNGIGLTKQLEWKFTKRFREKFTYLGQVDGVQNIY